MKDYQSFLMTDNSVVIIFSDCLVPIDAINPYCRKIKELLLQKKTDEAVEMINVSTRLKKHTSGRFFLENGVIVLDGEPLPVVLSNRVLQFVDADLPYEPLIKFWENLKKNPSKESCKDLYGFLEHNGIPLTADGCFVCYKRITENWKDVNSEIFDNSVGSIVKMDRDQVDADRNVTCSSGLHVAAYNYANGFYPNGILVEVKVNPMNVVAVPVDYNNEKMRVCEYEVIKQCGGERVEPLYDYIAENTDIDDIVDEEDYNEADYEDDCIEDEEGDLDDEETLVCSECGFYFPEAEITDGICEDCEKLLASKEATVNKDSRGRVCVPSSIVNTGMHLFAGDKVFAWAELSSVKVTGYKRNVPVSVSEYSVYTVDKSGNIRISNSLLKDASMGEDNEYDLFYKDGILEIS